MRKVLMDWDFKTLNPVDFVVSIDVPIDNNLMRLVWDKAVQVLNATHGSKLSKEQMDLLDEFEVPESHFKVINTALRDCLKTIWLNASSDGIKVIDGDCKKAKFKRLADSKWMCMVEYRGHYVRTK
jgi:hypothetical protein